MIGRLTGPIVECSPGRALLEVGGVGYAVEIPLSTFYELSRNGGEGPVSLHVHTHVREDQLQLYGFVSRREREVFERLIGISGVGPKLALAILSGIGVEELVAAVEEQDRERMCRIPGVGRKTAERLLLELRDKLGGISAASAAAGQAQPGEEPEGGLPRRDAISALVNLGYTRQAASRAVDAARDEAHEALPLEALLRSALTRIVGAG